MANNKMKPKKERPLKFFESEELGLKFSIPERPNVFEQLKFQSAAAMAEDVVLLRFWHGALELLKSWECEILPDPKKLNMENEDDPRIVDIVRFVGSVVSIHLSEIGSVPKNG